MPVDTTNQSSKLISTVQGMGGPLYGPGGSFLPKTGGPVTVGAPGPSLTKLPPQISGGGGGLSQQQLLGSLGSLGGGAGGAVGGIINLLGGGGEGGEDFRHDALIALQSVQIPDFDFSELTPPQLRLVALMSPEVYEAQVPQELKVIMDSPQARAQMEEALQGLGEISREGLPEADRLAAEEAANQIRGALQSSEEAFVQNLRRRGRLGAGAETQARSVAARGAAELGSQMGRGLQAEALQRRLQGLKDFGSAAGMKRAQDVGVQQSQADAMNRFQEIAASQRQQAAADAAAERQRVQGYNVGTQQDLATQQQLANYQTQQSNLERQNELERQRFYAEQQKAAGLAGQYGRLGQVADEDKAARERNIQTLGTGVGGLLGGGLGLSLI